VRPPNLPSVFRNVRTRPRGFNYTPRYYDERKEELEKRIRIIEKEVDLEHREAEIAKARMSHKFRERVENRNVLNSDKTRLVRLVVIIGILLLIGRILYSYIDL
jgi:hypothetical protein